MKNINFKLLGFLMILTASMLVTAACSGSENNNENGNNNADQKEDQNLLAEIKERGVLKVGTMGTYEPYTFMNSDNEIDGFDADIAKEVADSLGVEVKFEKVPFSGMISGLQNEKFDVAISQVTITPDRKENVDFTQPYVTNTVNIIVSEDNDSIHSLEDFKGQTIGIGVGTNDETYLRNEVKPDVGDFTIKTYDDVITTLMDLQSSRIDATINNEFALKPILDEKKIQIKTVGEPVKQDEAGIAIAQDHPKLLEALNSALDDIKEDGTHKELHEKWFDKAPESD